MRILFVSNLFPPYSRGGYEQWCEEVAVNLTARGHTLAVLTSRAGLPAGNGVSGGKDSEPDRPFVVHRLLYSEVEGGMLHTALRLLREPRRFDEENLAATRNLVNSFRPDAVLIWGMWNIARSVPQLIERQVGSAVAYYFCDYWPSLPSAYVQRLQEPARRGNMQQVKSLVGRYFLPRLVATEPVPLRFEHPICVSRAVCDLLVSRGVQVSHAQVIYGGTAAEEFRVISSVDERSSGQLRLLYMGRLERIKGVHTVLHAMHLIGNQQPVTLDILGAGEPDYVAELHTLTAASGLQERVSFLGSVQRSMVPAILAQYDALVFPSEWEEPFARTVLEAMAAGLPVIGTTTGGTGEILIDGETGLTYSAGDAEQLAAQILRLAIDPALQRRLSDTGRCVVRQRYTLERMVDELESALYAIAGKPVSIPC
jgi:glycosyltransferase involved in cell wall biosynthesis